MRLGRPEGTAELAGRAPWELVLAADVLYELRNVDLLLGLLARLVGPGGQGEVLLADPGRPPWTVFEAGLADAGWLVAELPTPIGGITLRSLRRPDRPFVRLDTTWLAGHHPEPGPVP